MIYFSILPLLNDYCLNADHQNELYVRVVGYKGLRLSSVCFQFIFPVTGPLYSTRKSTSMFKNIKILKILTVDT